jgi:mRNA interferase RelE/StbE
LDNSVKILVFKQIKKLEINPNYGESLGNKAGIDLTGYRKLYANKKRIRIIYKVTEEKIEVLIIAINKRDKLKVYEIAELRK